jgi:hypothetical protein
MYLLQFLEQLFDQDDGATAQPCAFGKLALSSRVQSERLQNNREESLN